MKVAVMQPYFFPYLGYFRLCHLADVFIVFDNVQFPRRGWVHRNRVWLNGQWVWITLPIEKAPRSALISDLHFRNGDLSSWIGLQKQRIRPLSCTEGVMLEAVPWPAHGESVVDYLQRSIEWVCDCLSLHCQFLKASDLVGAFDDNLSGTEKIWSVCRAIGASEYLNLPGGRSLYDRQEFRRQGIELSFLPDEVSDFESVLGRLLRGAPAELAARVVSDQWSDQS